MRRRHHPLTAVIVASIVAVPSVASTALGVTVGETFNASIDCDGITVVKTVPIGSTSFVVPSDGVLISWSTSAESGGNTMAAVVYRQVGGDYTLVGTSDRVVPVGTGVKTYPANIAVRQGDLLGSWVQARNGGLSVQKTCSSDAGPGQSTTWWRDTPTNVWPPTAVVPIANIGWSIPGGTTDTAYRYNISAELGAPAPAPGPVPDPVPSPATPAATSTEGASTVAPPRLPETLAGTWSRPSKTGLVRVSGPAPAGTTSVIQTARALGGQRAQATRGLLQMARSTTRSGTCTVGATTYRCGILLAPGRWVIATSAAGTAGVLARSTRQVRVARPVRLLAVTG